MNKAIRLKDPRYPIKYDNAAQTEAQIHRDRFGGVQYSNILELMNNDTIRGHRHDHFKGNLNPCFIETGTHDGQGVLSALRYGYKDIHSVEIQERLFEQTAGLFLSGLTFMNYKELEIETYASKDFFSMALGDDTRISLYRGDSVELLPMILQRIKSKSTFWLDAHYSGGLTGHSKVSGKMPLFEEVEALKQHDIRDHTIMIDDIPQFEEYYPGDLSRLKSEIYEINENYTITEVPKPYCTTPNNRFLLAKVVDANNG